MSRPLVLVVEDHLDSQELLLDILQVADMDALATVGGEQALHLMRDRSPDLVLLDYNLSGTMTGIDALKAIRADPSLANTPVVMLTAQNALLREPEAEAADLVLLKPVEVNDLVTMITRLLKPAH